MKTFIITLVAFLMATISGMAQTDAQPDPQLEFALELKVQLGQAFSVGQTVRGNRCVVPITGGTFQGPGIRGEVLSGGADYQLVGKERTDVEAIYCIRTDDSISIHVRNVGIIAGKYFYCTPKFEAPLDSKYAWLNNAIFICRPAGFENNSIVLRVWKVI